MVRDYYRQSMYIDEIPLFILWFSELWKLTMEAIQHIFFEFLFVKPQKN